MDAGAWIAIASIAAASAFSLIGLVIQGFVVAFHFGRHSQRLAAVEERTAEVDQNAAALAVLTSTVGGIDRQLQEVALDVKNLLIGRAPGRRRDQDG